MTGAVFISPRSWERHLCLYQTGAPNTQVELTPSVTATAPEASAAGDDLACPFEAPTTFEESSELPFPRRDRAVGVNPW